MAPGRKKHQVGVRELRQNLSVHLDRVKAGERLEVTEYGRAVALLVPLPAAADGLERMIAEGRATRSSGDPRKLPPPVRLPPGTPSSQSLLDDLRADRI